MMVLFVAAHESEVGPTQTFRNVGSYVGCSGWSGLVMLSASFSGYDPFQSWSEPPSCS